MLADYEGNTSFGRILWQLRGVFTVPTYLTFCGLVVGMIRQSGVKTVCGMLVGAGLSRTWRHERAHRFFSRARWSVDDLGLVIMGIVVERLLGGGPVRLVVDDTLFVRWGRKVALAFWQHDGSGQGPNPIAYGNNFVVLGVLVKLPFRTRPMCLPVLFRIWRKGGPSRAELARELVLVAQTCVGCVQVDLVGDAAYAAKTLLPLPGVRIVSRLRKNAALYRPAPPRTGRRGRPRTKGARLPSLERIANDRRRRFKPVTVTRYGRTETVHALKLRCLWYSVFGSDPVCVVLLRDSADDDSFDIALICSDPDATAEHVIERYAERWAIEVCFADAKQTTGVGEAENRVTRAVERTVPFGMLVQTLTIIWYALHGHTNNIVEHRRQLAPWYLQKAEPSYTDMHMALHRQLNGEEFMPTPHQPDDPQQMDLLPYVWVSSGG